MVPFDFQLRTRVVFGQGSLARLGPLARELGFHRTLLVADAGVVEAGHAGEAARLLEAAGIETAPFHDFGPNPDSAMVDAGAASPRRSASTRSSGSAAAARSTARRGSISC